MRFYRQKVIGRYIVDFYAPTVSLVIEVDGGQHFDEEHKHKDKIRDLYLRSQGLKVLRYDNIQVLKFIDLVVGDIFTELNKGLNKKSPL